MVLAYIHLLTCLALTYAPFWMLYNAADLAEDSKLFWIAVKAGGTYVLTMFCKMILMATFVPHAETGRLGMSQELVRLVISVGDVVGLYFILANCRASASQKILSIGVGWAFAEALLTNLIPLWINARGLEFTWEWLQLSFKANVQLLSVVSLTALIWLIFSGKQNDATKRRTPLRMVLLGAHLLLPSLGTVASQHLFGSGAGWQGVGVAAVSTTALAGLVKMSWDSKGAAAAS